ncbi:hypothetical protein [Paenibacillus cucumis (ex Kampfer et al. 2016)]|uniref:Glycosyl-hydrolase family 116 catalytic region domain-containing protein n=1 Tax=Paenibacillus cucumis (ex Kampfer et al. 2016) TaxID=1776858 RepID=A0ABS7KJE0_9BACL|nr:hypothetical protein [Paenibacillus cucumis (ex Kampfer et al. 2016)]MBY0204072.1 hypothetical protein [Paenibacillus cucumis (ex Kampfer et al. 2016)]
MELIFTARSRRQEGTAYTGMRTHNLQTNVNMSAGTGSADDPKQAQITIKNEGSQRWSGVIHVELAFDKQQPRFFLPAFMYGRNRGEAPQNVPNEFPRIREGTPSRPSSLWWMVRSDRLSHPAALVYDSGRIAGLSASPYWVESKHSGQKQPWYPGQTGTFLQYGGFTCSIEKGTVGYTLGYENAPLLFIKSRLVHERSALAESVFVLEAGESVAFTLELYDYESSSPLGINPALEHVYQKYHEHPRQGSDIRTAVSDMSAAVRDYAWLPDDRHYSTFVYEDAESGGYRYNKIISISWTNGMTIATPMLLAALRQNDEPMRQQALSCITNIIENAMNSESGLPYDAYQDGKWSIKGWWFDGMRTPGHSSYLVAQAMFYILKCYDYECRIRQIRHDDWLAYVKQVLECLERSKNADGEYPTILSERTGAGLEYDAFSGAWCLAAKAYYSWLINDLSDLEEMRRSETHYYNAYVKQMECYGAPLDADKAVDSEGILAYIKALRFLHALSGEETFLNHMRDAISYEFSFKFCYNSPVQIPPLSTLNWSSSGGSVTSVANPHIHPMSSNLVDELLYYLQQREDDYIRQRMNDTVAWGCQTYNRVDGEYGYGKKGWMSERFCHSQGLVTETYADGTPASTWFCLMPWASGSIIEGLVGDYWDQVTSSD